MRADPHQVVEDTRDFVEHDADILRAFGNFDSEQLLDGEYVTVLIAHHRDVIEPIHIADGLVIRLGFGEFLGTAMQQADVGVGAFDDFAIHFQHQSQDSVGRGMLWSEVERVILDVGHQSCASSGSSAK